MATTRLQLHLSAKDLKNLGRSGLLMQGKSDPFVIVTVRGEHEDNAPQVIGQTEIIFNNLDPSWSRTIYLEGYKFGVNCYFEVGVFDFDASSTGKSEQELSRMDVHTQALLTAASTKRMANFPHKVMGTALFEVGQVLGARGNVASKSLQTGGAVYVLLERCTTSSSNGKVRLHLCGRKLKNMQGIGRTSCPFFELYRKVDRPTGATWISVYRSNVCRADLSPLWTEVHLDLEACCHGDLTQCMKVLVWDHRKTGKHKLMGEFETTMQGFVDAHKSSSYSTDQETSPDHPGFVLMNKHGQHVGHVQVLNAQLSADYQSNTTSAPAASASGIVEKTKSTKTGKSRSSSLTPHTTSAAAAAAAAAATVPTSPVTRPEFVDYLSGGCQISLAVAIDFTASNGDPRQPGTPHYFHPPESKEWNDYEKAIFAVGSILAKYDSDQKFPVWGFGAKYNNMVRHCFQCGSEVEVEGVQGIMDAYRGVFRTPLTMSYPTKFTEVIQTAASYARHEQEAAEDENKLSYTILLILTAGNVENVKETKQQLIEASKDPLSVVIVGIGDADFSGMEFLDEHDENKEDGRDITKFVRFSDYKSFNALTEAVLDEIPNQLVTYFYDKKKQMPGKLEEFDHATVKVEDADDETRTITFLG